MKTDTIHIISFRPELASDFSRLNVAWLEKYFYVEPIDEEMLGNPQKHILDAGGKVYFAICGEKVAGTCALLLQDDGNFELGKMAVSEQFQGRGIGHLLLEKAIKEAHALGAEKLILYSNRKLLPALHLYRKFGFREIPVGNTEYKRSDIKMERGLP